MKSTDIQKIKKLIKYVSEFKIKELGKWRLGTPSTLMNTNRKAPKCLIVQSGLIKADSQIPPSHQQTQECLTNRLHVANAQNRSSNPGLGYLKLPAVWVSWMSAHPAVKEERSPTPHNRRRLNFKKQKLETDYRLSLHASTNYQN